MSPSSGDRKSSPYRGRFAPTPSGPLHFGSLVAAVASYAEAKSRQGTWALRIDDIDTPRVVPGAADQILRIVEALGMEWDGEVVYQSSRHAAYHAALHELRNRGVVYPCACTRREIALAAISGIEGPVYPGTCRTGLAPRKKARAWRLNTGAPVVAFDDEIQGTARQDIERTVGDFVVYRADNVYAYHLASVVDDAEQGITHVVRGADLIDSTPRQILLQSLLGVRTPRYAHVPVAVNAAGEKLSKQTHAPAIEMRASTAAIGHALRFLGQDVPDVDEREEPPQLWKWIIARWRLDRVPKVRAATAPCCPFRV